MNTRKLSIIFSTAVFGLLTGYLSGLETQPIFGLAVTAVLGFGALLLGLFNLTIKEEERAEKFAALTIACPQRYPYSFAISVLLFSSTCYIGLQYGIQSRSQRRTIEVANEIEGFAFHGDERLMAMLVLKRLNDLGFSEAERRAVFSDFSTVNQNDLFAYSHSDQHKFDDPLTRLGEAYEESNKPSSDWRQLQQRLNSLQWEVYRCLQDADHGQYHRLENMLQVVTDKDSDLAGIGYSREVPLTGFETRSRTETPFSPPEMRDGLQRDPLNELKGVMPDNGESTRQDDTPNSVSPIP